MKICEIFTGIQGESTFAGLPCIFVRTAGCNLRCTYCDTKYAYKKGKDISVKDIIKKVRLYGLNLIEITGGEPLNQEESIKLIDILVSEGFKVLIETNGSFNINNINKKAIIIMDIKTPKSGMLEKMDLNNLKYLKPKDEIKFVIVDKKDYEWVKKFLNQYSLFNLCKILLSPAYLSLNPKKLSKWIVKDKLPVRLNLQIHKYIYTNTELHSK